MYSVCRRVFFTEQILFFGESLQYEILEEVDGTDTVVESGVLKKDAHKMVIDAGRFHAINDLLESKALHSRELFEEQLEDYLKKEFIGERLFTLIR